MDRPSPVPSPAGLVVKNGLNSFSFTSGGMPVPLSRIVISTLSAEVPGRGGKRGFVIAAIGCGFALGCGIEAVCDQVEQHPGDVLREQIGLAGGRVEGPLHGDVKTLLLGPCPVIGEIKALLDEGVDIHRPVLAGALAGMQQHVLDDRIGTLAVLHDLVEIVAQGVRQFGDFGPGLVVGCHPRQRLFQFVDQLDGNAREIVDEIERVFDLVRNAGGELAERGKLLGLHKAVLRGAQIVQRLAQIVGALAQFIEQSRVLDGDDGLRGEVSDELDLFVGERANLLTVDREHADHFIVFQHRHADERPSAGKLDGGDAQIIARRSALPRYRQSDRPVWSW